MDREQVIKVLNEMGVPLNNWSDACAYANTHALEFSRAVAITERQAWTGAFADIDASNGTWSARTVASCGATATTGGA